MAIKLKEADAEQALALLNELVGPSHPIHWEFQDAFETVIFVIHSWPHENREIVAQIGLKIRPNFDKWFPPQEQEYTWMVVFFEAKDDCSGVLICGLE